MSIATRISRRKRSALNVMLVAGLAGLAGSARADISARQAQALGEYGAYLVIASVVGVLGACASTYPNLRDEVVAAVKSMGTGLPDAELPRIISDIGRCMGSEGIPTSSQCSDLATKLISGRYNLADAHRDPMLINSQEMLEPCR